MTIKARIDKEVEDLYLLFANLNSSIVKGKRSKKISIYGSKDNYVIKKGPPILELRRKFDDEEARFEKYIEVQACFVIKHKKIEDTLDFMKRKIKMFRATRNKNKEVFEKLHPFMEMSNLIQERKKGKIETLINLYNPKIHNKQKEDSYLINVKKFDEVELLKQKEDSSFLAFEIIFIHSEVERIIFPLKDLLSKDFSKKILIRKFKKFNKKNI